MNLEKRVHPVFQSTLKLVPYQYKKSRQVWQTKKTKYWMSLDAVAQSLKILVRSLRVLLVS